MSAATILDVARVRGIGDDLNGEAFARVGLPIWGGCAVCGATIAAFNACPSRSGYLKCAAGCIGTDGWDSAEEADRDMRAEEIAASAAEIATGEAEIVIAGQRMRVRLEPVEAAS